MTPERLSEMETWAQALVSGPFQFSLTSRRVGEWMAEIIAEERQLTLADAEEAPTVHVIAATGLGYVGRPVGCTEARAAGSMPCPLCKEEP